VSWIYWINCTPSFASCTVLADGRFFSTVPAAFDTAGCMSDYSGAALSTSALVAVVVLYSVILERDKVGNVFVVYEESRWFYVQVRLGFDRSDIF